MREGKEKDGKGRLLRRMFFMPKVTHRTGGTRRTKKQSVHYRILRSYKDTLHVMPYHCRFLNPRLKNFMCKSEFSVLF